jgi:hypothetical protein
MTVVPAVNDQAVPEDDSEVDRADRRKLANHVVPAESARPSHSESGSVGHDENCHPDS